MRIADNASLPATGSPDGTGNNAGSLARINVMRQEPGPAGRLFINDLTGLSILDPGTKSATTYLDFSGAVPATGLFDKPTTDDGLNEPPQLVRNPVDCHAMPQPIDTMFQVASSHPSAGEPAVGQTVSRLPGGLSGESHLQCLQGSLPD